MNPAITPQHWTAWSLQLARDLEPTASITPDLLAALSLTHSQQRAASRLLAMAQRASGALLADAPGLGKSRVGLAAALSLARARCGPLLICAPSRLLPAWRRLLDPLNLPDDQVALWSHAAMSRDPTPPLTPACLLVDEAHHMRHAHTRRASALRDAIGGAAVVLLTATPLCRDVEDVVSLLKLFIHDDWATATVGLRLDDALAAHRRGSFELSELLSHIALRREGDDALIRPTLRLRELPYDPSPAELTLWSSLEPSLASLSWSLMGDRWPRALFIELARHRWESGPHALAATLSDTLAFHDRALQADAMNLTLDPDAFATLFGQTPTQEVLPWCWESSMRPGNLPDPDAVLSDRRTLSNLLSLAQQAVETGGRDHALVELVRGSPDRWLILTQYETTATALYHRLAHATGGAMSVGLMTGRSARVTGLGPIAPEALLARFSPHARQLDAPATQQAVQLLVATDCMAEGVDLQDCARLVLVDLPYAPLVIEQRVGRLVRPHSTHREVEVTSLRPSRWRDSLGTITRLSERLVAADRLGVPMRAASAALNLPNTPQISPLEASLLRDALAERLPPPPNTPLAWRFWRVEGGPGDQLWIFARLSSEHLSSGRWCRADASGVELRLEHLLPGLITLSEQTQPLLPWRPGGPLWAAALDALEAQRACLHASQLAPHRLLPGCPQRRAWTKLCEQGAQHAARVQSLHPRLMRPLSHALCEQLEAALRLDLGALLRAVESLPEPISPQVQLLGGILR
jgi:hypothetical protein